MAQNNRRNNKYGKKKPMSKGRKPMDREEMREDDVQHKYNDVSWYAKNPAMLRDAASFSYNSPLGNEIPVSTMFTYAGTGTTSFLFNNSDVVPGLMGLYYVPTIGISKDSTSPANLAAQNIYSYVRYMNSGAKNYDQADLMLYLLAMDSIYMAWNWGKRIYGYARIYEQKNRYLPRVLAAADGVDIEDIQQNLADFRLGLNSLAAQISSFCVPAVMPLFVRHSWLTSNIYKDSANDKSQMYMFVPNAYYIYDEKGSEYGGQLLYTLMPGTALGKKLTYTDVLSTIKVALDAVAYSEDIGVMSGDILKAYGQDKLFKIAPVEPDYEVIPVYNEEVLNQIHNSTTWNAAGIGEPDITQDPNSGYLIWNPTLPPQVSMTKAFINMPWNDVTPENTMVGTRLTALLRKADTGNEAMFASIGTEFISARTIYYYNPGTDTVATLSIHNVVVGPNTNMPAILKSIALTSNFDWHPLVWAFSSNNGVYTYCGVIGDIDNYTFIENYSLQQMHLTAILSEFNVPQLGSF